VRGLCWEVLVVPYLNYPDGREQEGVNSECNIVGGDMDPQAVMPSGILSLKRG
jgi:hypothetical protein